MRGLLLLSAVLCLVGGQDMFGVPTEFFRDYLTTVGSDNIMFVVSDDITGKTSYG